MNSIPQFREFLGLACCMIQLDWGSEQSIYAGDKFNSKSAWGWITYYLSVIATSLTLSVGD